MNAAKAPLPVQQTDEVDCQTVLEAQQLGWTVHGQPIVEAVNLRVRKGEMLGLIGPNGSGKSTLLKMLAGIQKPSHGQVLLHGQTMRKMPRRVVARQLALVSQMAETMDAIRVRDAVELGRTPWLSALQPWSAQDNAMVLQALECVGMTHKLNSLWSTLSGGERQRVHIARALAQCPDILLLDEPTNHLDIQQQLAILQLVRQLPVTVVVALHDLNQAQECDRVAVMQRGSLMALGAAHETLNAPLLQAVFGVRMTALVDPEDGSRVMRFRPLMHQPPE